jgi:Xaa-Pro aminopeptidase
MQIHEQPRVSPLGKGKLRAGHVVSCEPGIYIPDWGGVRIEDLILITPDGGEVLCKARKPKKIIAL